MKKLEGAFPVLVTPMHDNYEVDWDGFRSNIDYFVDQGVAGIAVNGSTGEFVSLTKEERLKLTETAVDQVNGRIALVVGTAAERTEDAIMFTQHAEKAGADAALVINSYYAGPTDYEVYHQFKSVAESVKFPVMIYNNPGTSGVDIGTEAILQVGRDVENITHIKESSGDIGKVRDIIRQGEPDLITFCGADNLALECLLVGAKGWISVAGNIAPKYATDMFHAVKENNIEKAWEIWDQLLPLADFLEGSGKFVQITKRAMTLQGLAGGPCRLPRQPITDEEEATLKQHLSNLDLLRVK